MIRKVIVRLFLGSFLLGLSLILLLGVCVWLATVQPSFHSELAQVTCDPADQEQLKLDLEELQQLTMLATQLEQLPPEQSTALNKTIRSSFETKLEDLKDRKFIDSSGHLVFSQLRINQALAEHTGAVGDLQNVRVKLTDGQITLGGEIKTREYGDFYPSIDLRPTLTDDGRLKLELLSGHIGLLPIPISFIAHRLPDNMKRERGNLELHTDAEPPYCIFKTPKNDADRNIIKQVHCSDGQIKLELKTALQLPAEWQQDDSKTRN